MRRLLTSGWLAPAAGKLKEALQHVVAKNDAAQAQAKAIKTAEDRVSVLQKQIAGWYMSDLSPGTAAAR